MEKEYTNKEIRRTLKKKGIPVKLSMIGARRACRKGFKKHGNPRWAFKEHYGIVILDLVTKDLYNRARKVNGFNKLRVRDLDSMCVYRYPKKGWMVQEKEEK